MRATLLALLLLALPMAAMPPAAAVGLPVTVPVVCAPVGPQGPDHGVTLCVDHDGPCYVREVRQTIAGPLESCLVGA